ncbi:MAG: peptide chain release factor 2 [Planctomycetaceae bacterium]|nr:peptide chain release factor 2 [Planctomycetaceae bacterium]
MEAELRDKCDELVERIEHLRGCLDYAGKQKRLASVSERMNMPDFWNNSEAAQETVAEMRRLRSVVGPLESLLKAKDDLAILVEFAEEDPASEAELQTTVTQMEADIDRVELQATMSAPEDACGVYLQVQAGEGGTDSADWAQMLLRMYARWAERHEFDIEEIDISHGEEAGIRNATIAIRGDYVYGYLKGETGNHRLIRISPFDSAGRRHTAFAAVDVSPELDDNFEVDIDWESDVREDTYRSGGAGGQHVNKTDSAIRLTHLPSGVVVQCQNERSQHKNRATARKMLQAKLYQMEMERRDAELAAKRGAKSKIGFGGTTVRNYVLHPDQYVKDARTGTKVGNPQPVLDGDLDEFLESFLRWTLSSQNN